MATSKQNLITHSISKRKQRPLESQTRPPIDHSTDSATNPLAWLTLEVLLIGLILIGGVSLRLWNLSVYPLSDIEAEQSLAALQFYRGADIIPDNYSPLLVSLNGLTFFLFQPSDATARLASVLFGVVLIVLPLTLRRQLGVSAGLLAAALFAISPTAIYLSRTINGEIAVAAGALMLFSGFFNWVEDGRQRWLYLLAGGAAVMLAAGPLAISMIIIFGLIILVRFPAFRTLWHTGLSRSLALEDEAGARDIGKTREKKSTEEETEGLSTQPLRRAGIFFLVALVLLSTAAMFNIAGFSVTTNIIIDWIGRFSFVPRLDAGFNAVFLLTIYEILIVVAGLVGLAYALLSKNIVKYSLAGWFLVALVIDLIMVGRPNGSIILLLTPLVFLAALALDELRNSLYMNGSWSREGIILASGLVIFGFGYIGLTGWLDRPCGAEDTFCQFAWIQSVAAISLFLVVAAFFWFAYSDASIAIRGVAVTGVVLGLFLTISITWRLNFGPLQNLAYQPLAGVPPSTELGELIETLSSESLRQAGDASLLEVTSVGVTPALLWQLREFENLTVVDSIAAAPTSPAVITLTSNNENINLGEAYIGQDFALNAIWSPVGLAPKDLINWLIYRETDQRPQPANPAVLWLHFGEG